MKGNKRGILLMSAGVLLIALALGLVLFNVFMDKRASASSDAALKELLAVLPEDTAAAISPEDTQAPDGNENAEESIPDYILNPEMDMPEKKVESFSYIGIIEIPSLGITLPVISHHSESALNTAPCRYSGSVYTDDMVIAGHNFTSHFGKLDRLCEGDTVYFTDMDGNRFEYVVDTTETLEADAVEEMKSGKWALSLFTCTLSGHLRTTVRLNRK